MITLEYQNINLNYYNVDKTLDLPTWKETRKYITKLLNEKTGHDLMNEGGLGFVMEEFKHGGMSSGGISFKFWQMRFFPQLLKEFEK